MERRIRARLTAAEGRSFAFPVALAFLALAGLLWWRGHFILMILGATLGGLLLLAGLVVPTRLGPVQRNWMKVAHAISKVTTPIFMGIVYFLVITPIGLLRRTLGRNPVGHEPNGGSYWKKREEGAKQSDLERQF